MATPRIISYICGSRTATLERGPQGWRPSTVGPLVRRVVVTNLIDESYLAVDIPKLRGADRRSYVELQLQQRFSETQLRATLPFKSPVAKDRLILTGVGNLQAENTILGLVKAGVEILGVWSLPTLLMDALAKHRRKLPKALLAVLPTPEGLRLLFVLDGQPTLTRLLSHNLNPQQQNQEIVATRRYLEDGRIIDRGGVLALLALDCEVTQIDALASFGFRPMAPPWRKGSKGTQLDRLLDNAFKDLPGQLAPSAMRERFRLRKLRTALVAATTACVGMAALAGMQQVQSAYQQWDRLSTLNKQRSMLQETLAQERQMLESFDVDAELLLAALNVQEQALAASPLLAHALQQVSNTLQAQPVLRLNALEWRQTRLANACEDRTVGGQPAGPEGGAGAAIAGGSGSNPPGMPEPTPGAQAPALELRITLQAPTPDSPVEAARLRREVTEALQAWPQATLRSGAEQADTSQGVLRSDASGGASQEKTESLNYCLAFAAPKGKAP